MLRSRCSSCLSVCRLGARSSDRSMGGQRNVRRFALNRKQKASLQNARRSKIDRAKERADFELLAAHLKPLFLRIKEMAADGNCLFRALAGSQQPPAGSPTVRPSDRPTPPTDR